jgi:phage terminase large subunit GpA-like protein
MDEAKKTSREADRISQLEVRGDAFGLSKRVYLECTASIEEGRIWQEYLSGTHCRVIKECPYCSAWVTPEREHITGWQDCANEKEVLTKALFICPACQHPLTVTDRVDMVQNCRAEVENPYSLTFSIRWNAFDNLFWTPAEIGLDEWRAAHKPEHHKDDAQKVQMQFKWAMALPAETEEDIEPVVDLQNLPALEDATLRQGVIPSWAEYLTIGMDVHAKLLYWALAAWAKDGTSHIVDYGRIENPYKQHGQEYAVELGLVQGMGMARGTWQQIGVTRGKQIDGGLVDARWLPEVVRKIASGNIYPSLGFGATNNYRKFATSYNPPKKKSADIPAIGERWHIVRRKPERGPRYKVVEHDVDYGKTWIHRRLATPEGQPGRMTLYHTMEQGGHDAFMEQVTSEVQVIKKGIIVWEKIRTNNHWLDALVYAATAARMLGVKVTETEAPSPSQANQSGSTRANAANTPTIRSRY